MICLFSIPVCKHGTPASPFQLFYLCHDSVNRRTNSSQLPLKNQSFERPGAEVERSFSQMSEFLSTSLVSVLIKFQVKLLASYGTFASWLTEVLFSLWERGWRRMDLDLSSLCLREQEGWNNTPHFSLGNESYYLKNYNMVRKKFC